MSRVGYTGLPGVRAAVQNVESEIYWGGDDSRIYILRQDANLVSTAVDAGNTPTTYLRKGLILGKVTASGKLKEWNPDGSDGSEIAIGILDLDVDMLEYGAAADAWCRFAVRGPIKAGSIRAEGTLIGSSTDGYLARRQLAAMGFVFDDDPQGLKSGLVSRIQTKATDYTVVAADNGSVFHAITANATFTLPALVPGLSFEFVRMSGHNLVVTSAEGDNIIVGNDLSADSITYSTANNLIGARVRVESMYVNGTLKWLAEIKPAPFSTGAFLTQTLAT